MYAADLFEKPGAQNETEVRKINSIFFPFSIAAFILLFAF